MRTEFTYIPRDFNSVKVKLASPDKILEWSHGEITRAETINYRTQKPERDGLFCEKIFGPIRDYECHCGKYRRIRYKGIICDRCGVEVTRSIVRRVRMGHIKLVSPVTHIWFLKGGGSSKIAMVLGLSMSQIERVVYFASYIITEVNEKAREQAFKDMESEYKMKSKKLNAINEKAEYEAKMKKLNNAYDLAKEELKGIKKMKVISEIEYRNLSIKYGQVFEAEMGAAAIRSLLTQIDLKKLREFLRKELESKKNEIPRKKIRRRLILVENLLKSNIRPEWMIATAIPVIPPDLRPMVPLDGGRYATADLNDLYRRVINRNNRLKKLLELGAPEVITRNEKRMLQEAVDSLFDNQARKGQSVQASTGQMRLLKSLADSLKGKQGRFRQNLLGKRVDYSGRSVIVVGPNLKLHQCGLPKSMALELFKPFVINQLIEKGIAHNVRSASRVIDIGIDEVWQILEQVIKDKVVLLNRAPTLHRLGIQAFYPVLVEDKSIHVHPLVCPAFNADFDGDQMAVHLPLTRAAVAESKKIMLASKNLLKPSSGLPIVGPEKEMILGCYYLTVIKGKKSKESLKSFSDIKAAKIAYDLEKIGLREKIKVRIKDEVLETSIGRIIFNEIFPEDYPFINEEMSKKKVSAEIKKVLHKYGEDQVISMVDKIKDLGFEYATQSGNSLGINDLHIPENRGKIIAEAEKRVHEVNDLHKQGLITKEERYSKLIEIWTETKTQLDDEIKKVYPKNNPLYDQLESQTQGWPIMSALVGMKGLVANPAGRLIETPIKDNFKHGYNVLEFFTSTHGTRKGLADTALKTSSSGYLTRRMVDVCQEVVITEKDCMDEKGYLVERDNAEDADERFQGNIEGRVCLEDVVVNKKVLIKAGDLIMAETAEKIIENKVPAVRIRSALSCKTRHGVCQKCYGTDLGRTGLVSMGQAVGVVAAQALGEPGTQLTMRTKNIGSGRQGAGKDIVTGLPRVEELMEVRSPKNASIISDIAGKIKILKSKKNPDIILVQVVGKEGKKKIVKDYNIPEDEVLLVANGDLIGKADQITEGSVNIKELYQKNGFIETATYIIREIQKIYASQGEIISGKHVEIIVRQMFSRFKITDAGDTELIEGDIVTHEKLQNANDLVKGIRKKEAKAERQLLGISKASLSTDSFLSAASFKETSRVLIEAAVSGKEDKLLGLKENVIIGKLIPAGTGFKIHKS